VEGSGQQDHVRLLNGLESSDGRAVEPVSLLEGVLSEVVRRYGEVLHQTGEVAEPEVNDFDPLVRCESNNFGSASLLHVSS
jgi:hypothetical protein